MLQHWCLMQALHPCMQPPCMCSCKLCLCIVILLLIDACKFELLPAAHVCCWAHCQWQLRMLRMGSSHPVTAHVQLPMIVTPAQHAQLEVTRSCMHLSGCCHSQATGSHTLHVGHVLLVFLCRPVLSSRRMLSERSMLAAQGPDKTQAADKQQTADQRRQPRPNYGPYGQGGYSGGGGGNSWGSGNSGNQWQQAASGSGWNNWGR
jgi:hypothetical protein